MGSNTSPWEEKDRGQITDNPHLIARRHLSKGGKADANIINLVQSKLKLGYAINQSELEQLSSIKPISIIFESLILDPHKTVLNFFNKHKLTGKTAGVYIWTNLQTGEQNVGSSIDLITRLRQYFKPSILQAAAAEGKD